MCKCSDVNHCNDCIRNCYVFCGMGNSPLPFKWRINMSECIIDGTVEVTGLKKALEEHNQLLKHQNTILSGILDELTLIRREKYGSNR